MDAKTPVTNDHILDWFKIYLWVIGVDVENSSIVDFSWNFRPNVHSGGQKWFRRNDPVTIHELKKEHDVET